ncbi:MAG: hypothetical protein JJ872_14710 [Marivivens sp.]|nr:hypothetical protein [Marivivens sp.]
MNTNIQPEHISAFEALTSGEHDNFALFSCFLDGVPAVAIVAVTPPDCDEDEYQITPLFVGVTEGMILTDHDGTPA